MAIRMCIFKKEGNVRFKSIQNTLITETGGETERRHCSNAFFVVVVVVFVCLFVKSRVSVSIIVMIIIQKMCKAPTLMLKTLNH